MLPKRVVLAIVGCVALLVIAGALVLGGGDGGGGGSDAQPGEVTTEAVTVSGEEHWTYSGLDVSAGDSIHITAGGTVSHDGSNRVGPDGADDPGLRRYNVLEDGNHSGLLGRVGDEGDPFVVGSDFTFTAENSGPLYLGINDQGLDNNSGAFEVTVEVTAGE